VYLGTSATIASNGTAILSSGNMAMNSTNQNWFIDVYLTYDSQSKVIGGVFQGYSGSSTGILALTVITETSTGSFSDAAEGQGFTITATCGGTSSHVLTCAEIIPE